jgi:hypothetical protein
MAHPYPYGKLSDESKRVLVAAQKEAEGSGKPYIGTEHLLLAMLRLEFSTAYRILTRLDVSYQKALNKINAAPDHGRRRPGQQVIPTSRVKRVIELAFGEADRMKRDLIDSVHLLMGLVLEGEGIAALVLEDFGATAERVIAEAEREGGVPLSGRGRAPASNPPWATDLPEPPEVVGLRDRLASVRFAMKHAMEARDTEHALKLGSEENRLQSEIDRARRKWLASLG